MPLSAILPYTALLGFLYVGLAYNVVRVRRRVRAALGDKDNPDLQRAIRAHGNCGEYAPFGLLLIAFYELTGGPFLLVHALGLLLVVGRGLHAYSILRHEPLTGRYNLRFAGMLATFLGIILASLALLVRWVSYQLI